MLEQGSQRQRKWGAKTADERQAARRERIVTAAIKLYGEMGYRSTSVKAVCKAADLTERYFYESFANSEDLLQQCFRTVTNDLLDRMRDAAREAQPTALGRARAALLVYLDHLRHNPASARVFLIEIASVSPATEALVSASLSEFGALLKEFLQTDPNFGGLSTPLLLRGVVGGGLHIVQAWIESGYRDSIETVADLNLRLYTALIGSG